MTYLEIANMIYEFGFPYAFDDFPDDTEQEPPYVCYYYDYNDFKADNSNYVQRNVLTVDFYSAERNFVNEHSIENVLDLHGFSYGKEVVFNESERLYQIRYTMEVLINE